MPLRSPYRCECNIYQPYDSVVLNWRMPHKNAMLSTHRSDIRLHLQSGGCHRTSSVFFDSNIMDLEQKVLVRLAMMLGSIETTNPHDPPTAGPTDTQRRSTERKKGYQRLTANGITLRMAAPHLPVSGRSAVMPGRRRNESADFIN